MSRTNTKALNAAITTAAAEVEQARTTLAEWVATRTAAQAELASLESRSGAEVLDDPEAAERLPRLMAELRDRVDIAKRAIAAQEPRVAAAERRYWAAEADALEAPIEPMRAELTRHEARTAELLQVLERHEGRFVPEAELLEERWSHSATVLTEATRSYDLPKSEALRSRIAEAELPVRALRELAAGRDPSAMIATCGRAPHEVYPAGVWGPGAVVPVPAYVRATAAARQERQQVETALASAQQRVEELEAAIGRGEKAPGGLQDWTMARRPALEQDLESACRTVKDLSERAAALPTV